MEYTKSELTRTFEKYNKRKYVHPDPLEFLYEYETDEDREVVGLIASSLAYGRVQQILVSVSKVLKKIGPPREFVLGCNEAEARGLFKDYKHRFTTGDEMASLLFGMGRVIEKHGSLNACFKTHFKRKDETILSALNAFTRELGSQSKHGLGSLIPDVERGSACKRLCLYLRWMVRNDAVDPGAWNGIPRSKLIVPVDVHMHRMALAHGLTSRKNADMRTALEITEGFKKFSPRDPVKYDFALTRPGIAGV